MAIVQNAQTIDLTDIQGMVTRGYSKLVNTAYFLVRISNGENARSWLKEIVPLVDSADHSKYKSETLHLAFGVNGLRNLGLSKETISNFPIAFQEGISTPNRNRVLGDYGENAPNNWRWGGENNEHVLMIFHGEDEELLESFMRNQRDIIASQDGISIVAPYCAAT